MQLTGQLQRLHAGDHDAMHDLIPLVYDELKKLASAHLRREPRNVRFQTTVLVHEAFVKLAGSRQPSYENRTHFYGIASRLMRQVLVDAARSRSAGKRDAKVLPLLEISDWSSQPDRSVLAVDETLRRLEETDPLKAKLIEMRYFGGMTAEESAQSVGKPVHFVRRELRLAHAWLRKEMASQGFEQ